MVIKQVKCQVEMSTVKLSKENTVRSINVHRIELNQEFIGGSTVIYKRVLTGGGGGQRSRGGWGKLSHFSDFGLWELN